MMISTALATPFLAAPTIASDIQLPGIQVAQAVKQFEFKIAAQPLSNALLQFGRQTGLQISADAALIRDLESPGAQGMMSAEMALEHLLQGTGLTADTAGNGSITVKGTANSQQADSGTLAPIVVQGNYEPADQAGSITLDLDDLERRNPATLKQIFSGESSVSVGGAISLSQKLYVNGVEETNLAVSIDGARQNNKIFHHNGTNLIDPALLKAARVDPGVAPADAGPGALGGAIVYETVDVDDVLEPGRTAGGFQSFSITSNGETFESNTSVYGKSGNVEALGFFKMAQGDDYYDGAGSRQPGTGADMKSGLGKFAAENSMGHRFEFTAERVRDNAARPFRANLSRLTNRSEPSTRIYDLTRSNYTLNFAIPEAKGLWDPTALIAYSLTELAVPTPFGSEGETGSFSGKFENKFNLTNRDSLTAGADFYNDKAKYADPSSNMRERARNLGGYAQARLQPLDPLKLSFGGRVDHQRFKGVDGTRINNTGLSGNASVAYDVTDKLTLNAGYSNVFGGVSLAENFIMNANWDYSGGIAPVRSRNYTSGFEVNHDGFTFEGGIFRTEFDDARDPSFSGGPGITVDFRTNGYKLGVGYEWQQGFAKINYTDSAIKVNGSLADSDATQYLGSPLGQVIALEARQNLENTGFSVGGSLDIALKNKDTEKAGSTAQEGYEVVNLYTEYAPEAYEFLTLRLEANNLFDEDYADRATYGQEFSNVNTLKEPGRTFLFKAKATF